MHRRLPALHVIEILGSPKRSLALRSLALFTGIDDRLSPQPVISRGGFSMMPTVAGFTLALIVMLCPFVSFSEVVDAKDDVCAGFFQSTFLVSAPKPASSNYTDRA